MRNFALFAIVILMSMSLPKPLSRKRFLPLKPSPIHSDRLQTECSSRTPKPDY